MERKKTRTGNISKKRNYSNIILVIFIAIFIFSLIKIVFWFRDNQKIDEDLEETVDIANITETDGENVEKINPPEEKDSKYSNDYFYYMSLPFMSVQFDKLKEKNSDTVAWLKVAGTSVNYPVVQTDNNDYYLTHAFDNTVNEAGWLFADYRCDLDTFGKNNIIYGHSRRNNTMFGSLLGTTNEAWCSNKENTVIYLSTEKYNTMWQVFAVYTTPKDTEYLTTYFASNEAYLNFLNDCKNRSIYNFGTAFSETDSILTLSTCAKNDNYRVVIQAKLIKKNIR